MSVAHVVAVLDRQVVVVGRSLVCGALLLAQIARLVDVDQRTVGQRKLHVAERHQPVLVLRELRHVVQHDRLDCRARFGRLHGRRRQPVDLQAVRIGVAGDDLTVHVDGHPIVRIISIVRLILEFDPQTRVGILDEHRIGGGFALLPVGHGVVARRAVADDAAHDKDVLGDLALAHRQQLGDRDFTGVFEGRGPVGLVDHELARQRGSVSLDADAGLPGGIALIGCTDKGLRAVGELPDAHPRSILGIDQLGHPVDIRRHVDREAFALDRHGLAGIAHVDLQHGLGGLLAELQHHDRLAVDHDVQLAVTPVSALILLDERRETGVPDPFGGPEGDPLRILGIGGHQLPVAIIRVHQKILHPATDAIGELLQGVPVGIKQVEILLRRVVLLATGEHHTRHHQQQGPPKGPVPNI